MAKSFTFGKRLFRISDPGIANDCILLGSGGEAMQYSDFVFLPDGSVSYLTYLAGPEGNIPATAQPVALLTANYPEQYLQLVDRVEQIEFFSIRSKRAFSDTFEYLVVANPQKGIHGVHWESGAHQKLPPKLRDFVVMLRNILSERFGDERGI